MSRAPEQGARRPRIGVVGAGILGTVLSLRLAQGGADVTLLERAPSPGGLAGSIDFAGHRVDRFYHVIVPSDERMIALAEELGLGDQLSFTPVGVGFFVDGEMHPFNGIGDFLRFPPLSLLGRARLAWFVAQCQLRGDYSALEHKPLEAWLTRHCGRELVERIWRPLLDSRFDSRHDELPATYLWARTNRMRSAREGRSAGERMGCLKGGHERLVLAAAERAEQLGVDIRLGAGVEGLLRDDTGAVTGVRVDGEDERFDLTIATLQPPALRHLLPEDLQPLLGAYPSRYLGVVCLVLKLRRSLLPYYSVNICDPTPITTVVETSHVVGTEHTDGLRLAYLPKYCDSTAPEFSEDDARSTIASRRCSRAWLPTSATRTSSTGRSSALRSSSPSTRSATSRASRRSGRASKASAWLQPARSTRACSTASRSSRWPTVSPARR